MALAEKLEIDVALDEALAEADIQTHVADSLPEKSNMRCMLGRTSFQKTRRACARAAAAKAEATRSKNTDVPHKPVVKPGGADRWSDAR